MAGKFEITKAAAGCDRGHAVRHPARTEVRAGKARH